eukprot:5963888-Amphidinium_carterae.1
MMGVLRGTCFLDLQVPALKSVVRILSVHSNDLEGYLPSMRLNQRGKGYRVLAYNNHLSCLPPRHPGVKEPPQQAFAMVLMGNRFTEPRTFPEFPSWIHTSEQGDYFVVANRHAEHLLVGAVCSGIALALAFALRVSFSFVARALVTR